MRVMYRSKLQPLATSTVQEQNSEHGHAMQMHARISIMVCCPCAAPQSIDLMFQACRSVKDLAKIMFRQHL